MVFKRAKALSLGQRLRLLFWPRRGWGRSVRYIFQRLKRVPSSPHRIALGAAIGVFAVFTPFLGIQLVIAGVLALMLRGSILASFLASFVGNPLTYPVIWFATFNLGNVLLGQAATGRLVDLRARLEAFWDNLVSGEPNAIVDALGNIWPIIKPMAVGSLPLGIFAACAAYVGVRWLIGAPHVRKGQRAALHTFPQIGSQGGIR
jgi:uncharacterized protein (DUF2062 family)